MSEGPTTGAMPEATDMAADLQPGPDAAPGAAIDDSPLPDPRPTADTLPAAPPGDADRSLLALIDRLADLLRRSDLSELEVEAGRTGLVLRKPSALASAPVAGAASGNATVATGSAGAGSTAPGGSTGDGSGSGSGSAAGSGAAPGAAMSAGGAAGHLAGGDATGSAPPAARASVKAPLTGIFYGSPSPGAEPYVRVGGEVAVGQVIGLIEAMKLFNEIKSDLAGRVVRIVAEDGTLVKAKQPLIEVEPL